MSGKVVFEFVCGEVAGRTAKRQGLRPARQFAGHLRDHRGTEQRADRSTASAGRSQPGAVHHRREGGCATRSHLSAQVRSAMLRGAQRRAQTGHPRRTRPHDCSTCGTILVKPRTLRTPTNRRSWHWTSCAGLGRGTDRPCLSRPDSHSRLHEESAKGRETEQSQVAVTVKPLCIRPDGPALR